MKKKFFYTFLILTFLHLFFAVPLSKAQIIPEGFNYQAIARNNSGVILANQNISVKISIYSGSTTGTLQWEEEHNVTTDQFGLFNLVIGQGISTSNGLAVNFYDITWSSFSHFIKVSVDAAGGATYTDMGTTELFSVPYALYAKQSGSLINPLSINDLDDVDTTGVVIGNILKWNGSQWSPAIDNVPDTVSYAINAGNSFYSDTAIYALNSLNSDTSFFSYYSDTATYALNAGSSTIANTALYSDTATYAFFANSSWDLSGNATPATNFVGTTDSVSFIIKTNNSERLRITASGKYGFGTSVPSASFHLMGDDGLLSEGVYGLGGTIPSEGAGTRMMWYLKKAAFRAGRVNNTVWDDVNTGYYSFAGGWNTQASGAYSMAMGESCVATGNSAVAMGSNCFATGAPSIVFGDSCTASLRAIAMGISATAGSGSTAVSIGYKTTASGSVSAAFGNSTTASGNNSTAMGYYASTSGKVGSFVYADASSTSITSATANHQFMVRASGGIVFYSDSSLMAGVTLPTGGGSWASVSDRNKKENIKEMNGEDILRKIAHMNITTWNYKSQDSSIRHAGPMAQDFYRIFGLGESDTTITTIDIDGISMMGIKALQVRTDELKKSFDLEPLKAKVELLQNDKSVYERIEKLEAQLQYMQKELNIKSE